MSARIPFRNRGGGRKRRLFFALKISALAIFIVTSLIYIYRLHQTLLVQPLLIKNKKKLQNRRPPRKSDTVLRDQLQVLGKMPKSQANQRKGGEAIPVKVPQSQAQQRSRGEAVKRKMPQSQAKAKKRRKEEAIISEQQNLILDHLAHSEGQIWLASMIRDAGEIHDIMFRQLMKLNCLYGIHMHFLLGSQAEAVAFEKRRNETVTAILSTRTNSTASSSTSRPNGCASLVIEVEPTKQTLLEMCAVNSGSETQAEVGDSVKDIFPFLSSPGAGVPKGAKKKRIKQSAAKVVKGTKGALSKDSALKQKRLKKNSQRVQRISFWRHYQRRSLKRIMYPFSQTAAFMENDNATINSNTGTRDLKRQMHGVDDIVILMDADLVSFGEYHRSDEDVIVSLMIEVLRVKESRKQKSKMDEWHIICALGVECENRYYDTFATVVWPETFVYPLGGRWAMNLKDLTHPEKRALVDQLFPLQNQSFVMPDNHYQVPNEHNVGKMTQAGFRQHLTEVQKWNHESRNKATPKAQDKARASQSFSLLSSVPGPVRMRSCFGGVAVYRADVFFCQECDYASLGDSNDGKTIKEGDSHDVVHLVLPPEYKEAGNLSSSGSFASSRPTTLETMNATHLRLKYAERFGQMCEHIFFHECLYQYHTVRHGSNKDSNRNNVDGEDILLKVGIQPRLQPRYHGNGGLRKCSMPP